MPLSANEMKEKMNNISKWITQTQTPKVAHKKDPKNIKKLLAKVDVKNPHAIRDLFGSVANKPSLQRRRYTHVQRSMAADEWDNRAEMNLRKEVDAAWEKEVRERQADLRGGATVCCQCGTSVVVWKEIVAPVCLTCYHTICDEKCVGA